uniref:Uncharacterized protein n=1 Tax=Ceratitis capitata TaxID=7213 RepID=W8ALC1_CERCA
MLIQFPPFLKKKIQQQQQQPQQETQLNTEQPPRPVDSNAEFSSRFASIVAAPNNLIHETDAGLGITINSVGSTSSSNSNSSSSSTGSSGSGNESVVGSVSVTNNTSANSLVNGSIVKETISFSTETRVVRKKKSRKHRGRKLRKSRKHNTATTIAPADVEAGVTLSPKSVSNADESAQNSSSTDLPDTTTTAPITTTTPRVRVVHIT